MFIQIWAVILTYILEKHLYLQFTLEKSFKYDEISQSHQTSVPTAAQHLSITSKPKEKKSNERLKIPKTFNEMAKEAGLKTNEYEVTTEDGYILTVFHIQGNGTKPVLLMHGFLDSADGFILRRNTSLIKVLVDAGYDAYIGNLRGNKYARKHISKNPDVDKAYWDFSFHEMGIYDLPSTIDFMLNKHEVQSLPVVGFSQGNQIIWIMASERPEYNKKIQIAIAMAPICFIQHLSESLVQILINVAPVLAFIYNVFGIRELVSNKGPIREFEQMLCTVPKIGYQLCTDNIINLLQGKVTEEFEPEFLINDFLPQFPTSTSVKNGLHLVQLNRRKKFAYYDYGFLKNIIKYKSIYPPDYNLRKVTMDVVILRGANDLLSNKEETDMLISHLPNIKNSTIVNCTHMDFMWGRHANVYAYKHILQIFK